MVGVNYFEHYLDFCGEMWHNIKVVKITAENVKMFVLCRKETEQYE